MKKLLKIAIMVSLLLTVAVMPAQAAVVPDEQIMPMAMYHQEANASLYISSSGTAEAEGAITGLSGTTTKCSITLYLQRYENGSWRDVAMWTDSANTTSLTITRNLGVDSGYKYRVKAICYAYSGSQMEYVTRYSLEIWY